MYLDGDRDGYATLEQIDSDGEVGRIPPPTSDVSTSRERYQVLWRIRGTETARAEDVLRRLAHHYGTDVALTDCAQVMHLPGFRSRKRDAAVSRGQSLGYAQRLHSRLEDFQRNLPLPEASWPARPAGFPGGTPSRGGHVAIGHGLGLDPGAAAQRSRPRRGEGGTGSKARQQVQSRLVRQPDRRRCGAVPSRRALTLTLRRFEVPRPNRLSCLLAEPLSIWFAVEPSRPHRNLTNGRVPKLRLVNRSDGVLDLSHP